MRFSLSGLDIYDLIFPKGQHENILARIQSSPKSQKMQAFDSTMNKLTLYKVVGNYFPPPVFEIHTRNFLSCFSSFHLMIKIGKNFRKKNPLNVLVVF